MADFIFFDVPRIFLVGWLVYASLACIFYRKMMERRLLNFYLFEAIPGVFTNLGLFGTFMGITAGLLEFNTDPSQIKDSISLLLEGLKLAFFTSIFGIFFSIIFAKIVKWMVHREIAVDPDYDQEIAYLQSIDNNIKHMSESIANSIDNAIVNSLKGVVEDVNETFKEFIDQLVSDNFEKLTQSIDQLVEWQKMYRDDILAISGAYSNLIERHQEFIDRTEDWLKILDEITGNSSKLKIIIDEFKSLTDDDARFKDLVKKTVESSENLHEVSMELSDYMKQLKAFQSDLTETKDTFKSSLASSFEGFDSATKARIQEFDQSIAKIDDWLNREEGVLQQVQTLSAMLERLRQFEVSDIEKLDESFNNRLQGTFRTLDNLMTQIYKDKNKRAS